MAFRRKLVFSSFLLACILVSSSRAATVSAECDARKAACDATCQDENAISDFKCDEQNGAISSSCACAAPGSSSSSSSSSASSGSDSNNISSPPNPAQATEPQTTTSPSCEQKQQACVASCPEGTSAQFDCKQDQSTKSASASADSCVCSPVDASTNPPQGTAPNPSQGTVIAPVTGSPDPNTSLNAGNTAVPGRTAGSERSTDTTVVNSAYTNKAWKVLTGSLLGAALLVVL